MATFPGAVSTDSDLYIAVNQTTTQLTDNPLTSGATTVNVISATAFPTVGFISIDAEIIKYTGKTATSFTGCTRGSDGTSASSHVQNSQVYHNVIAAHHNAPKDEIIAVETFLNVKLGTSGAAYSLAKALQTNSVTGIIEASGVSNTELSYLSGVTSAIQTQLNATATDSLVVHLAGTETITGAKTLSAATGNPIHGTNTNDSASAGYIGEFISSTIAFASRVNSTGTTQWTDLTSVSLTAGDWDVWITISLTANGASVTQEQVGFSTTSGNSATGLTFGDTAFIPETPTGAAGTEDSTVSFYIRISLSATTTHYAKFLMAYTVATPQAYGNIRARRVR